MLSSQGPALAQHLSQLNELNCSGLIKLDKIFEYKGTHYCIIESVKDMVPISEFKGSHEDLRQAFKQVVNTLKTMHGKQMYHGNLKTANILVNKNGLGEVKIVT